MEMVEELPAACRKRNIINIVTFCDNANPILDIKKTYSLVSRVDGQLVSISHTYEKCVQ